MALKLMIICLLFGSCASNRMMQTDLYFAQSKPNGDLITEKQWDKFTTDHISRIFVKGSTVYSATGHWLDPERHQLITERTYVVSYVYKRSRSLSNKIDSLRLIYTNAFDQQSVLRIDKKVRVKFH